MDIIAAKGINYSLLLCISILTLYKTLNIHYIDYCILLFSSVSIDLINTFSYKSLDISNK